MINAQQLQGQWNQLRGRVKEKWGQLTDDDLNWQGGNLDQLVGKIQQRTGEGREAIEGFLGNLTGGGASTIAQAAESVRDFAGRAGEFAQPALDRLREGYGQVSEGLRGGYDSAEDFVRHRPAQSVAAAFGVGIVVGLVVGVALRSR